MINILFFGATADIVGTRRIQLDAARGKSLSQVCSNILHDYPDLDRHELLFSINEKYATGTEIIRDGDELAIFTAVSGG